MRNRIQKLVQTVLQTAWVEIRKLTFVGLLVLLSQALLNPGTASALEPTNDAAKQQQTQASVQLESFDAVWNQVRSQYFDYARIESAWQEARETYRPRAAKASTAELRRLLNEMLELVGESHFVVLPPTAVNEPDDPSPESEDSSDPADPPAHAEQNGDDERPRRPTGLGVRLIDDALIVDRVGPANAGVIETGWELLAVGDQSLGGLIDEALAVEDPTARARSRLILEATANGLIGFPPDGRDLVLSMKAPDGELVEITARTAPEPVQIVRIGNLPGLAFSYRAEIHPEGNGCVGVVTFTSWVPELMDRFLESRDELFACQGLVFDLRGNLGGVLTTMMPLTSHLVDETVLLGQLKREDARLDFRVFPRMVANDGQRIQPYDGPVAILIDSLSASTSEMFSAGMQALGRARIFGTQSPGMALPAQMLPLANGDRLMYAFADYIDGQGRRIEGIGVTPDEVIEPTRATLSTGDDPVLKTAMQWIENAPSPEDG